MSCDEDGVGGGTGVAAGVLAASGATPYGWVALGIKALSGNSINKSGANADAQGGFGIFSAQNKGGINSALIQFDEPVHVVVASVVVIGIVYAVRKWVK